ncbi:MAG: hypothetical protein U0Q15_02115 [Kineosporiaceae bacterium]
MELFHRGDTANELMYLNSVGPDVVTYRDEGLASNDLTFARDYSTRAWQYIARTYPFLSGQRLFVTLHDGPGSGGTARNLADDETKYRLLIDVDGDGWRETYRNRVVLTHEMGHVVEGYGSGVHGSPAFGLWGDSKWAEIFQYDVFKGLGDDADAQQWLEEKLATEDDYPVAGAHWFRDFFLPIYRDHGGTQTLVRYFDLLSKNFHQLDNEYRRDLTWGEFVHFWSGAAGVDVRPIAEAAFGWTPEWDAQLQQARVDFPGVTYTR